MHNHPKRIVEGTCWHSIGQGFHLMLWWGWREQHSLYRHSATDRCCLHSSIHSCRDLRHGHIVLPILPIRILNVMDLALPIMTQARDTGIAQGCWLAVSTFLVMGGSIHVGLFFLLCSRPCICRPCLRGPAGRICAQHKAALLKTRPCCMISADSHETTQ